MILNLDIQDGLGRDEIDSATSITFIGQGPLHQLLPYQKEHLQMCVTKIRICDAIIDVKVYKLKVWSHYYFYTIHCCVGHR